VPQEHDLPVVFVEQVDRGGKPPLQFVPGGGGGGRELSVGDLPAQIGLRLVARVGHHQRHLTINASRGRHAVSAVSIDKPVAGHVPQPELEWHGRVGQIVDQPAIGFDHHVLHDVAGIDPPLHPPVHATVDHSPDRFAVPLEQAVDGIAIALPHAIEQHQSRLSVGRRSPVLGRRWKFRHRFILNDRGRIPSAGRGLFPRPGLHAILRRSPKSLLTHVMRPPFTQQRTFRYGKYVLADDTLSSLCRPERAPAQLLGVVELLSRFPTAGRIVPVDEAMWLPEFHHDTWSTTSTTSQITVATLPARHLPSTSVLVVPRGRVVGRIGTIHVPAADACLQEFESPPRNTAGFRQDLRLGRLNPRFWKHVALTLWRERFLPTVHRCPGRVAVLNAPGSHNFFHWTSEVLPRLWTLLRSGEQADWFVVDGYARWQRESLAALGVPPDRVIQPHATLHLEADELLVPSLNPAQTIRPLADALAEGLGATDRGSTTRSIFIERSHSRVPRNTRDFAAWRRRHRFEDHRLEQQPLAQQVAAFRGADVVLAAHGAGLSHIVQCRPGTLVIELMPHGVNRPCYVHLSRIAGLRHVVIEAPRRGWHQDMVIPLAVLERALATAGQEGVG
jgi:hypothetical protein